MVDNTAILQETEVEAGGSFNGKGIGRRFSLQYQKPLSGGKGRESVLSWKETRSGFSRKRKWWASSSQAMRRSTKISLERVTGSGKMRSQELSRRCQTNGWGGSQTGVVEGGEEKVGSDHPVQECGWERREESEQRREGEWDPRRQWIPAARLEVGAWTTRTTASPQICFTCYLGLVLVNFTNH